MTRNLTGTLVVQRTQDLRSPDTRDVAEPRSDLTIGTRGRFRRHRVAV